MADFYEISVAPSTVSPVTLQEALDWCRVDGSSSDSLIVSSLVNVATEQLEKATNRYFNSRTVIGHFDSIAESSFERFAYIQLRRGPLGAVSGMTVEIGGSKVSFISYTVKDTGGFPRLLLTKGIPSVDDVAYPVEVTFTAGYSDVPEDIKTMIKQYTLFLYENRGDVIPDGKVGFPLEVKMIMKKYRIVNTYG